jgi:F0F1-type ATP synthase epsilon subunit
MVRHHAVDEGGRALVLVEGAVPADEIDAGTVQAAIDDARARIAAAEGGDANVDRFRAERDLAHAENQLRIAQSR